MIHTQNINTLEGGEKQMDSEGLLGFSGDGQDGVSELGPGSRVGSRRWPSLAEGSRQMEREGGGQQAGGVGFR